ncbi:MAG: carboxymuconolactone decarboxylase family protein [Noviherbaspirillum sp.]
MSNPNPANGAPQGFGPSCAERLPLPAREDMNEAQRAAADAIIAGPRKAVFGPFVPLLQTPALMERIGKVGESLRFEGSLSDRVRELAMCAVARETSNQFEWQVHASLAQKAGIGAAAIEELAAGRRPRGLEEAEELALEFVSELMRRNGVCDATYAETVRCLGEPGVVELTALAGYFVMVCWIMNVARTPGPAAANVPPLTGFPG